MGWPRDLMEIPHALPHQVPGAHVRRASRRRALPLDLEEFRLDRPGDALGYFVLNREDVRGFPVVMVGPNVVAGQGVDELSRDAHAVARLADAAFEYVADAQFPPDLANIGRFALVREA